MKRTTNVVVCALVAALVTLSVTSKARADVSAHFYTVGHHGSANGTTPAELDAITPKVSVISVGHHSTHEPGGFHAFQFGHPREGVVHDLEEKTTGDRPPATIYTMKGVGDKLPDRTIDEAIYCTCWDGDVVVTVKPDGSSPTVTTTGR